MRIERLDLKAYGPFTDLSLDFGPDAGRLCIVHGANEAGKSSTLKAIGALLFGIHDRTEDDFLHNYKDLRLEALLRDDAGDPLEVIRLKRRKHPLRAADDSPLDEAVIARMLPGLDYAAFIRRHGIDHVRLREGGDGLLQSGGEVGETLFAAGAGLGGIRALLNDLEADAGGLWLPRGRNQEIPNLLHQLQGQRSTETEATTLSADWARLERERRDRTERRKREAEQLQQHRIRRAHHERLLKAVPLAAQRVTLQRQLAIAKAGNEEVPAARPLPPGYDPMERSNLTQRLNESQSRLNRLLSERAQIEADLEALAEIDPAQAHGAAIHALAKQLPQYLKARQDLRSIWGRMKQSEELARARYDQVRPGLTAEEAEALKPSAAHKARLRALGRRYEALIESQSASSRRRQDLESQVDRLKRTLARLDDPSPPHALEAAVHRARGDGPLERQRRDLQREVDRSRDLLSQRLRQLGHWAGPLAPLRALALPSVETLDRFERAFDELAEQRRDLDRRRQDLTRQLEKLRSEREILARGGAVPTEADLTEARGARDQRLDALRRGEDAPWAQALDAVSAADAVADRLRREASRVDQHARLTVELERGEAALAELEAKGQEIHNNRARSAARWQALWVDLAPEHPIKAGSPREMRTWCDQVMDLRGRALQLDDLEARLAALDDTIAEHRQALAAALGHEIPEDRALAWQIEEAAGRCAEIQQIIAERAAATQALDDALAAQAEASQIAIRADEALAEWRRDWAGLVAPLDLPPEALPEQVDAVLEALDEASAHTHDAEGFRIRVRSIEHDERALKEALTSVLQALAPSRAEEPPEVVIPWLEDQATRAQSRQSRRGHLEAQLKRLQADEEELSAQIAVDTDRLQALCALIGAEQPGQIPALEIAAELLESLQMELSIADDQLRLLSAGAELDDFVAEVRQQDEDALKADLAALDSQIETSEIDLRTHDEALGALRTKMEAADNGGQAAAAHEIAEGLAERIRGRAEHYARLRLAVTLLRLEMEAHRARTQGPILARAGEIFTALTGGSFNGLSVDYDTRGEPYLQGMRGDGQRLGVEGMSEGSRDQLYLALRLAFLERGLDTGPRIPFIVDDILVHFDDRRSKAALEVLGGLSKKTQVIFFTHHQHLLDVAAEALGPDGFTALHLSSRGGDTLQARPFR